MMKYPIGIQNFEKLRSEVCAYVGKTPRQLLIFMVLIALFFPLDLWAKLNLGDVFTADGIDYKVISLDPMQVQFGARDDNNPVVDKSITGSFNIPSTVIGSDGNSYSVKTISHYAFYGCTGLSSVSIPNSVTTISSAAFEGCSGLTSITIPDGVVSIYNHAFAGCGSLTSVTIPNSVTYLGRYAFYGCSSLISVILPNNMTSIEMGTFFDCSSLTSVTIPNTVTSIDDNAFTDCSSLSTVTIPEGVTSIGNQAFLNCSSLTSFTFPSKVTSIGETTFYGCNGFTSMDIPYGITTIGEGAFFNCEGLVSVTIPSSVTSIDRLAFAYCTKLTSVTVNIQEPIAIDDEAFLATTDATLYVPKGSVEAYKADDHWKGFKEILPISTNDAGAAKAKMMVVTTMDGKQTKLGLKNEPNVTIEEPYLVYKSNVAEARFELDQLRDIKYEDVKPIPGDASGDGVINKADVDETIQYILGSPSDDFNFNNADVNNDQVVNIADVIHIINTINNLEKNERLQSRNTADSQQHQYAIYNYRNDNDFNAFLNVDIDKIAYSKIGIDSTVYNNVVVQEVWTPYQIYRIPIEAIDSLGFHTPETKYNEKVFFLTDNHIPYIKNVDDLTITFASSIPKDMLPVMGQIIVAETSEDPLEDGFAGRITNIVNNGDGKVFICEEVALGDIFDRLLFISKCATNSGLDEDQSNNVRRSRTRATIDIDQVIHIDLDPIEINPDDESENKEKFPITMKYQPDMSITCFVNVVKDYPAIAKITFSHSHSFYFQAKYEAEKEFSKEWWFGKKDIRIHIPVKAVDAVIKPYIRFGAFIDANCKAKFEYTVPLFKFEHTFGLDYNEAREEDNRVQFINDAEITHETPTMKLSVDGSLAFGLAIKLGAKLVHEKLLSFESTFHVGPKLFGHFDLYSERLAEDANLYRQLKTTTLQLNGYVAMTKATYRYFGSGVKLAKRGSWKGATWSDKAIKKASWLPNDLFPDGIEYTWYINKWYLLPHFDPPQMTELTESSALASLHPYHSVIFPVHIGLALKKYTTGDVIEYDYGRYWGESDYDETKFEHIFEGLEPSTTYKVYPTVSLFGLKMDAEPSTDYGVSDKLLINPNKITISKGETAEIVVTGGTGRYSSIDGNSKIAHGLSFNYDVGPKTGEKAILTIVGVNVGESIITILDTDNVSSCILTVNVIDSETPTLSVSSNSLNMYERTTCSVEITSGSGKYAAESSNTDVATVIVNDGKIQVTAIKAGTTTITVTDTETTQIATIEVTVTIKDISSIDLPAGAVDLGLSVKWASCNIGASKPEDFGEYYSWGEILPKEEYLFDTYKWAGSNQYGETISERYTKYNEIDGEIMIGMEDDAAFANTLGKFRMPTSDEFQELLTLCSYEFVTRNGVAGFLISANNGNRIFLPLAGSKYNTNINYVGRRGCYWASDLRPYIYTDPGTYVFQESAPYESTWNRYMGLSIRAVQDTQTPVASMELSNNACNFGKIPIGGKCFSDVFIKNTGKVNLKLNIPTPSLPFSMELARVNSIGSSMMVQPTTFDRVELLEGESLRIRIWFTPTELTKSEFLISVKTNSSDNDEIIFLKGEGTQTDSPDTPIDLGLSVNWSNHNIGATSPEKEGDLFAWGEIETKEEYTEENYKWYKGSTNWITKYYNGETYFFGGKDRTYGDIDNKTQLEASDDVARYVLGSHWKIPTKYECEELFSKCSKYWGFLNGVEGCFFKGSTDKTIFISVGSVWTSTISEGSRSGTTIQILNDEYNPYTVRNRWKNRESGLPVRPVNSVE